MTDRDLMAETEADDMMESVFAEASDPASPTLTPFITLGTNDPALEMFDGPTTPEQASAPDLWATFGKH